MAQYSLKQVGDCVGGRDHSTVLNGVDKIESLIKRDPNMKQTIEAIIKKIGFEL